MRPPLARKRICPLAAPSRPATVIAKRPSRPSTSTPSGRPSTSITPTSCSARKSTTPSAAMTTAALQERRNRQILAGIVRTYIETGEPVSSRAISKSFEEILSTATIRNVMADLEDAGYLYQPHTSAGRVPTAAAYRFFAQEIASQATISAADKEWIRREMGAPTNAVEITERAGHVLAEVSNGLGIVVSPPMGKTVLEHARMWLLPDGRVVVVLISSGGNTRDK